MTTEKIIIIASFCGFLFIFDAIFLGIILATRRKMAQASDWPSTLGTVTMSTVQRRRSGGSTASYPVVIYSYQIMGQAYEGHKIMPGPEVGGSDAYKVVERYPVDKQVTIYYDPNNPSDALLERGMPGYIKWLWVVLIALDVFLCGIGTVLLLVL